MHKPTELLLCSALFALCACKDQRVAPSTNTVQPVTVGQDPATDYKAQPAVDQRPVAQPSTTADNARSDALPNEVHANHPEDLTDMTEAQAAVYHRTCHFILTKMAACAKDRGFLKYQGRWLAKGAPRVNSRDFEKRVLSWGEEPSRAQSCKQWAQSPASRAHFASPSRLATLREDAKLSCELFGQELDDDGWFPAALIEG